MRKLLDPAWFLINPQTGAVGFARPGPSPEVLWYHAEQEELLGTGCHRAQMERDGWRAARLQLTLNEGEFAADVVEVEAELAIGSSNRDSLPERDRLAADLALGFITRGAGAGGRAIGTPEWQSDIAWSAYSLADAMIRARKGEES